VIPPSIDDSVYGAPAPLVIRLLAIEMAMTDVLGDGVAFHERYGVDATAQLEPLRGVVAQTLALYQRVRPTAPWLCYLAVDGARDAVIGTCGFTGGPAADGSVELAYFTLPGGEGRGYATLMAGALVEIARRDGEVRRVTANTLPERNASCRVLEKCGFVRDGEGSDPEVGLTWRWVLAL
jgi:RimJ/RimL family protein N-acetyltransferase